jgi:hypothetical protein
MSATEDMVHDNKDIPPCMIYVDKEGKWFHKGAPIIHRDLLALFYQSLDLDKNGEYIIKFKDQICRLDVEDTPYVVQRTDLVSGSSPGEEDRFVLLLIDHSEEDLVPETLSVGPGHVPYCKIRGGKFKARFSRASYYQIAPYIQEDTETGQYFLALNEKSYYFEGGTPK